MTAPAPPPTASPSFAERYRRHPSVWTLGLLNVAAFLWVESQAGGSTSRAVMVDSGALVVPLVPNEPWRLLTSTFLHFGLFHLLSNMVGLALFGPAFEQLVGRARFLALWLSAGLAGSAATALTAGSDGLTIAAGASGSVFGLLGAFLFLGLRTRHTPGGRIRLRQASVLLGINLAYGLVTPQIGMAAHVGGAAAGLLVLALYAAPRPKPGEAAPPPAPNRGLWSAIALGAAATAAALAFGPTL